MTVNTVREMFVHDLEDIYYAENELVDALGALAEQSDDEEIATAFRDHREETKGQIDRLDEVFELLGEEPAEEECEGIDGLLTEHEDFVEMDPKQEVLDMHNLTAGQKNEHYEIAAYGNLAHVAGRIGEDEVADLLGETLEEEKAALERLSDLSEDVDYDEVRTAGAAD